MSFKKSYQIVAGIDEVGRGAWAGPVTAAIVVVNNSRVKFFKGKIKDSKQLLAKQRQEIFEIIKQEPKIKFKVSFVWPQVIDRVNIGRATLLTWRRCFKKLNPRPDFLFLDGNQAIPNLNVEQKPVVKGDQKILVLALASIIAKVNRDKLMERLGKKYPQYGFAHHKGYGTKLHLARLKKYGVCQIHRKSFQPVFDNLSFKDKVYYLVSKIPKGQVMTYKQVAQGIGHLRAFRAVGNILNKNRDKNVPCHRVIRSDGQIGGFANGSQLKRKILEKEGFLV
ncbi:MAG: ribonuclease HII [Parcubacteria group bacterium]|nr:ribonuclease HII [Parcubacteria group bacterium]|tara:strand:+ start:737 stop:1576 length:840 start_codon:yes stop_codon:yes gene_type:complete